MQRPELVCPAGTPAALRTAVDAGADAVYCGFQNATNARNFPGLNFTPEEMKQGLAYAHERGAKVLLAANTFPPAGKFDLWKQAIDMAHGFGVDAIIVADIGVADYAHRTYPDQRLHLSVQAGASSPEAIKFYCRSFDIKRVVLPRILTVQEIKAVHNEIPCEIEAFIFGNIGMMAEGRCSLTNYATGISTNMDGVCSPAGDVHYDEDKDRNLTTRLGEFTIDCFSCGEKAGYPTICKGRYVTKDHKEPYYAFEEPISLNLTALLPELMKAGVTALKIEGRQRSKAYVEAVVSSFRETIDAYMNGEEPELNDLLALTEGNKQTEGAFKSKRWR
ncbi:MAG: U32 family peptidase [Micavibrio aeruginosavorus]|uniref:U32 family peptidase n=1 Tax=Micavibrio aeruginosavorus TaxID=349221 RepID=A0A7T5UJ52_9BACT|nr:MAG: U32 family peptidase [Micavibrio aeruginosavorus]